MMQTSDETTAARPTTMHVVPLFASVPHHTSIVVSMIVQSRLDYGALEHDPRMLVWHRQQGRWAVAVDAAAGKAVGIACVVALSDQPQDALLWLEVLPSYRHRGAGTALLEWAHAQTAGALLIKSVPSAAGFYQARGA